MSKALYTNNAVTTLPFGITSSATSITVATGSVFPSPTGTDYAYLTISSALLTEIVKLTARSGSTLTVVRGQQGTAPQAFSAGDVVSIRPTAAGFSDLYTYVDSTQSVPTRAALKALNPTVVKAAVLSSTNPLENGTYHWRAGDFSTLVTADTYGAYYLKADSVASSAGAYVLEHQVNVYDLNRFGADPTGVADSLAAYNRAAALITASGQIGQIEMSGGYRTSGVWVVTSNIMIHAKARSSLGPISGGTNAFRFDFGPGVYMGQHILPLLFEWSGIAIDVNGASLANIYCPQILAGNGVAVRLAALGNNTCLDNTIRVDVVGQMAEWVRVQTSTATPEPEGGPFSNILQGNVVTSNFVVSTARGVVFKNDDTLAPNWDSNRFEMDAWDPTPAIASSALVYARNTTAHDVARQIFKVYTWCGGFGATSKIVDAQSLSQADIYIGPASAFPDNFLAIDSGVNNVYDLRSHAPRNGTIYAAALTAVGKATWNSGVPLSQNTDWITVTPTSDLAANATIGAYVYHELADDLTNLITVSQGWSTAGGLICVAAETRGWTGADKEIGLIFRNVSGATITAGTSHQFKLKVGLP